MDNPNNDLTAPPDTTAAPQDPIAESPSVESPSTTDVPSSALSRRKSSFSILAPAVAIIAWFIPGLGHLVLRRWGRAVVFFIAVGGLAISGYLMRGNVFPPHSDDPFGTLGFVADACSGVFYLLSRAVEAAGPNVSRAIGDYGTRFIAAAGIVNVLGICDAYEIALGRRR